MLDALHDKIQDWKVPVSQAFEQLAAIATAHPILAFMVMAAASVYLLNRQSSAI